LYESVVAGCLGIEENEEAEEASSLRSQVEGVAIEEVEE
jgi:hypothetical protein